MRIAFLSPDEPFYLPEFYRLVLGALTPEHEVRVVVVPPTYKNTSKTELGVRYARTFGLGEAAYLSFKVAYYRARDLLNGSGGDRHYSLEAVLNRYRIPFVRETDVNGRENIERLRKWGTDLIISVSCPQIFKRELIDLPPRGCLNLHGSLLPDYRGVMPAFWVLSNNEKEAGITLFFVNERIDAGDVLVQRRYRILPEHTLDSLIRHSKAVGAEMVVEGVRKIDRGAPETFPLDLSGGNYYGWPGRQDVKRFLGHGRRFR